MKTLKTLLSVFAVAALFSTATFAQAVVTTTAEVINNVTASTDANINFGQFLAGSGIAIDPTNGSTTNVLGGTTSVGEVTVSGTGTYEVQVTFNHTGAFNLGDGGSETISFTPDYVAHSTTQGSASTINSLDTFNLVGGQYKIWIGGTIDATGAPAGTYTSAATNGGGDITVSVQYN